MNNEIIIRHGEPNSLDHAPYGTCCKVMSALSETCQIFIQMNHEESLPQWRRLGEYPAHISDYDVHDEVLNAGILKL